MPIFGTFWGFYRGFFLEGLGVDFEGILEILGIFRRVGGILGEFWGLGDYLGIFMGKLRGFRWNLGDF